jgi:hypothetical protein
LLKQWLALIGEHGRCCLFLLLLHGVKIAMDNCR